MNEIRVFSPATVSNVACGFDVLGFPLESVGDEMVVRKTKAKGIVITKIEGFDLPFDINKNVASVSAMALLEVAKPEFGFEMEIYKKIKPGSGIGSSGASATGSVYAINELLGRPFNKLQLTEFAMKGEFIASKSEHADNIAPAIFGGFCLVKNLHGSIQETTIELTSRVNQQCRLENSPNECPSVDYLIINFLVFKEKNKEFKMKLMSILQLLLNH